MSYLDMALRAKKEESTQDNPHNLIDETIKKIEMVWSEGMLEWIKLNRPEGWGKVLTMEGKVNEMALGGTMEGLRKALSEYQGLILAMVQEFKAHKGETGNLLEQKVFSFQMEGPKSPRTG